MILTYHECDKAPPILRNEKWRCFGDVESLILLGDLSGEVALGQRFRARTSLKSVAEHSWETNMAQCVAGGFLECLKANGDAKALCRRWLPCQRSLK